jgi:hypothetical protein
MRKITKKITEAFVNRNHAKSGNDYTDGHTLYLHGNKIAEWRDNQLWITHAGWPSNTTKERLNGLPGVSIYQKAGQWYLNGKEWLGGWTCVERKAPERAQRRSIYLEGVKAYNDRKGASDNPYPNWTIEHDLWYDGWRQADREDGN